MFRLAVKKPLLGKTLISCFLVLPMPAHFICRNDDENFSSNLAEAVLVYVKILVPSFAL